MSERSTGSNGNRLSKPQSVGTDLLAHYAMREIQHLLTYFFIQLVQTCGSMSNSSNIFNETLVKSSVVDVR